MWDLDSVHTRSQVPTCEPQVITKRWLFIIKVGSWLFDAKIFTRFGLRVGSSFLLNPTGNISCKPHLEKVLPFRHSCNNWDLGLGTPYEVVSPKFHALNNWDCMDWPHVTWDLGLGTHVDPPLGWVSMYAIRPLDSR